jgi:hypothetical protein
LETRAGDCWIGSAGLCRFNPKAHFTVYRPLGAVLTYRLESPALRRKRT